MLAMTAGSISVFLDTSYIRKVGFRHPDFQKLIEYTKSSRLKLFVSFIAWEERRTQFLTEAESQISKVRKEFDALSRKQADNFILLGLPAPAIDLWEQSELEARSHEAMTNFAKDNNISSSSSGAGSRTTGVG